MERQPTLSDPTDSAHAKHESPDPVSNEMPCPYLSGQQARYEAYSVEDMTGALYEKLLARGFRRSGRVVYRPGCGACSECRQIRVRVLEFRPTASMRRVMRRNADVRVEKCRPEPSDGKFELYHRYVHDRHDSTMSRSRDAFREFLYSSPTDSIEFQYRVGCRLVGVSIVDQVPHGLSSVYMFYDPGHASRSLGTFSILWEIGFCRREGWPFYYLGYYVAGCRSMEYKARFRPSELLLGDERWVDSCDRGGA